MECQEVVLFSMPFCAYDGTKGGTCTNIQTDYDYRLCAWCWELE